MSRDPKRAKQAKNRSIFRLIFGENLFASGEDMPRGAVQLMKYLPKL